MTRKSGRVIIMRSLRLYALRLLHAILSSRRRSVVSLFVFLFFFLILKYYWTLEEPVWDSYEEVNFDDELVKRSDKVSYKWIVCTTVHKPTAALRHLSSQLSSGWQMVVVGDRKTPSDWKLTGVVYLSVRAQKSLGYRIHKYLPYDSYSRKSIGYLYAIQHGAKYIYEIDDDNFPTEDLHSVHLTTEPSPNLVIDTTRLTYNPYVHFGQTTMWPRGYPLDKVGQAEGHDYTLCWTPVPAIQQGLADGDPDVDAIFRLTRRHSMKPLNITFDRYAPIVVLPTNTFSPYNSQNTLHAYRAFWALMLPTGVHNRVSDIYRAYWAQKLLWLVGGNLAFAPPNVYQKRSGHLDLTDAKDESEMYTNVARYIDVLNKWTCSEKFFFDCVSRLSHDLVREGLWKSVDAEIVDSWIADLSHVGYAAPVFDDRKVLGKTCLSEDSRQVVFYPEEQKTSVSYTEKLQYMQHVNNHELVVQRLTKYCGPKHATLWHTALNTAVKYESVLLVISVRSDLRKVVPSLEAMYKPHFSHILYCVDKEFDVKFVNDWKISVVRLEEQVGPISCLAAAIEIPYQVMGTLHITETMLLNAQDSLNKRITSLAWMTGDFVIYQPGKLNSCATKAINCELLPKDLLLKITDQIYKVNSIRNVTRKNLRDCVIKLEKDPNWLSQVEVVWLTDLAVYLPRRLYKSLHDLRRLFNEDDLKRFDFMTIVFIECEQLTVEYLLRVENLSEVSSTTDYVYPFYFNSIEKADGARKDFCHQFEQFH